jgi:hypothetical protein
MPFDVDRLLRLWFDPLPDGDLAEAAFRELYNDPVSVNGEPVGTEELMARARALQAAFEWPDTRVLSVVDGGRRIAVVFRLRGRQIGPLTTSAGSLPPTGRVVELRTIDVLTLANGRIREIWTVQNELGALAAVDAVELLSGNGSARDMSLHWPPWTSEHAH